MSRYLAFAYGLVTYGLFLVTFLYAIGFVGNLLVPRSIDAGGPAAESLLTALAINTALLLVFAIQHTIMARPGFKRAFAKLLPATIERNTFVLATCGCFALLFVFWQPLPDLVWSIDSEVGRVLLHTGFALGFLLVLVSTFLIDHFELFGLRQALASLRGDANPPPAKFRQPALYRQVRHPIMLGFLIAFWSTPDMTVGHLVFALATTGYILVGITFEERDLIRAHGRSYVEYRRQVPALLPFTKRRSQAAVAAEPTDTATA